MLQYDDKEASLDPKGRFLFPTSLRKKLMGDREKMSFTLLRGFENCIEIYTDEMWKKKSEELEKVINNLFNKDQRDFERMYAHNSSDVEFDSAGRILIPKGLIKYAKIQKDIYIKYFGRRIEVWAKEVYDNLYQERLSSPDALSALSSLIQQTKNTNNDK